MKVEFHQQNITKALEQRNAIAVVSGVQTLSMAVLIIALVCKTERTILMPPEIKREMWFEGSIASPSYLESMAEYISKLLLDITPTSFTHNHEQILKYATPEAYGALKKQLMNDGEQYTKLQLSTHFYPNQLTVNPKTLEVEVKGTLTSYISGNKVRDSQETITFKFTHRGAGMLLEQVSGGNPHAGQ
ncbi:MAG: type IV conjugative transfer system protein TraE [Alphaproteobacteria bacterium]|nr:type IV conjugative transfer system protein TraE [Alphaproteobacteria bacterium]